jgi:hypothetical protein
MVLRGEHRKTANARPLFAFGLIQTYPCPANKSARVAMDRVKFRFVSFAAFFAALLVIADAMSDDAMVDCLVVVVMYV